MTLAYDDLRAIALGYLQRGAASSTLQVTGLVNEVYLKLAQVRAASLDCRHFCAFAAMLMRTIMIDYFRLAKASKWPMAWIDAASDERIALQYRAR